MELATLRCSSGEGCQLVGAVELAVAGWDWFSKCRGNRKACSTVAEGRSCGRQREEAWLG